jgi:hypothetical protein
MGIIIPCGVAIREALVSNQISGAEPTKINGLFRTVQSEGGSEKPYE